MDVLTAPAPPKVEENCCYLCPQCANSFSSLEQLESHTAAAHNEDEEEGNLDGDRPTLTIDEGEGMASDDEEDILGQSPFNSTIIDERTGLKLYKCRFCGDEGKLYESRSQLNIHYTHTHRDKPQYECDLCEKVFAVKRDLATHRRCHEGSQPHVCTECGKEFGTRQLLKKHWMWHTGERSHVCPHCNKAFFQKGHLTQHLMIHAGGRPHICALCSKTFIFKFDLNRHMKIHQERGIQCDRCNRAFLKQAELDAHVGVCTGEPFDGIAHAEAENAANASFKADISMVSSPLGMIDDAMRAVTPLKRRGGKTPSSGKSTPRPRKEMKSEFDDMAPLMPQVNLNSEGAASPINPLMNGGGGQQCVCFVCIQNGVTRTFNSQAEFAAHLGTHLKANAAQSSNSSIFPQAMFNSGGGTSSLGGGGSTLANQLMMHAMQQNMMNGRASTMNGGGGGGGPSMGTMNGGGGPSMVTTGHTPGSSPNNQTSAVAIGQTCDFNASCSSCQDNRSRVLRMDAALITKDAELERMRETMARVSQIAGGLLESCTDFDKFWMLHSKKINTQMQQISALLHNPGAPPPFNH